MLFVHKYEWCRNSWWDSMIIYFCTVVYLKVEWHQTPSLSRSLSSTPTSNVFVSYSVWIWVSTLMSGQIQWPGVASSELLTAHHPFFPTQSYVTNFYSSGLIVLATQLFLFWLLWEATVFGLTSKIFSNVLMFGVTLTTLSIISAGAGNCFK